MLRTAFLSLAVLHTVSLVWPLLGIVGYLLTRPSFEAQRRAVFAVLASEVA